MSAESLCMREGDPRLDEAVVSYLEAVEAGRPPDREQWMAAYPELASQLAEFLADYDKVARWTGPLKGFSAKSTVDDDRSRTVTASPFRAEPAGQDGSRRTSLSGYEILGEIARGGMGVVFKARQLSLDRVVAVKMIQTGPSISASDMRRFWLEAETVARLDHPHITPIYEVGHSEGRPYFSMKLIEGGSLGESLDRFIEDNRASAELLAKVARGVHHAHQRGILHRDLKPGNVLLDHERRPYVTDFGLARRVETDSSMTLSGAIVGTPSYMSPEQASGRKDLTTAADVYSLGAILYTLLTGRPPFRGNSSMETLRQVVEEEPRPPRLYSPRVDRDLETICLKCLNKVPDHRYGSAEDLAEDLERWLAGEPIRARRIAVWKRALKKARKHKAAAAALVLSVLVVLSLIAGGFLYQHHRAFVAEQDLDKHRRLTDLERQTTTGFNQAQDDLRQGNPQAAKEKLVEVLAQVSSEVSLQHLKLKVDRLMEEIEAELAEQRARQARQQAREAAAKKHAQFSQLRDKVLFHGSVFDRLDLPANLEATRHAGPEALALVGLAADGEGVFSPDPYLTEEERRDITGRCYELLLVLAEVAAQETPPKLERALRLLDSARQLHVPTKAFHLRRSRYLAMSGDEVAAEQERQRAEALQPASALDHFLLGSDLRRRPGQLRAAIREFQSALRLEPDHFWARYFLSVSFLQANEMLAAKADLTVCIGQREFEWAYLLRGIAHTKLREFEAAAEDFSAALRAQIGTPLENDWLRYAVAVNRGVLWKDQGRHEKDHGRFEDAAKELDAAIKLKPGQYQAYWNLANVYEAQAESCRQQGRLPEQQRLLGDAVEQLKKAINVVEMQRTTGESELSILAMLYNNQARLYWKGQDRTSALLDLQKSLQARPSAEASVLRGRILQDQGQTLKEKGRILQARQKFADAILAYEAASKTPPINAADFASNPFFYWQALALMELEQYEAAARACDRYFLIAAAGRLAADRGTDAKVYQLRGLARAKRKDYSGAIPDYTQALTIDPDDPWTYAYRGWARLVRKARFLAEEDFNKAIELDPDHGDAYNGLGYVRVERGKAEAAVEAAEAALRCGSPNARTLWNAARVYAYAYSVLGRRRLPDLQHLENYRDRAMKLLGDALEETPASERATFWRKVVEPDYQEPGGAFFALRHSPPFLRLAEKYEQKDPPAT